MSLTMTDSIIECTPATSKSFVIRASALYQHDVLNERKIITSGMIDGEQGRIPGSI